MLYPSMSDMLKKVDSRYTLVMAVSKRARQIIDGDDVYTRVNSTKPVTLALHEVSEDKISINNKNDIIK
ncbi:DNA-directed RNA polymerase subunit omega [Abyssisolibacter fermentans]|uniref:DNA-directed RNA polymerase subunit omega n=1 Tax=Abyssisolibacter fermentans TaxID=1766203 RepID=UPI00082E7DAB|nr:DNA-directed RNA polymerase subunit omega [Abyssisolibacter fermentans]